MKTVLMILASALVAVNGLCPNSCSGHGSCGANDACTCDPNFSAVDCSERVCPFGASFVDTPLGDLNHDGTVDSSSVSVQWSNVAVRERPTASDALHNYAECSGKGTCDRSSGECQCFDGYTGSSCQRTTCPNSCSGHGVCRTLREITSGQMNVKTVATIGNMEYQSGATATSYAYNLWDADKRQACVCDAGYTGYDCSLRECPRGDDPLTTGARYCGGATCADAEVTFGLTGGATETTLEISFTSWDGRTHYTYATLANTDLRDSFASLPISGFPDPATVAGKLTEAVRSMPGGLLSQATVRAYSVGAGAYNAAISTGATQYKITLVGYPGKVSASDFTVTPLGSGGGRFTVSTAVAVAAAGNKELITCSGRGICDYSAGLCECFAGYYGSSCEYQNALAGSGRSFAFVA